MCMIEVSREHLGLVTSPLLKAKYTADYGRCVPAGCCALTAGCLGLARGQNLCCSKEPCLSLSCHLYAFATAATAVTSALATFLARLPGTVVTVAGALTWQSRACIAPDLSARAQHRRGAWLGVVGALMCRVGGFLEQHPCVWACPVFWCVAAHLTLVSRAIGLAVPCLACLCHTPPCPMAGNREPLCAPAYQAASGTVADAVEPNSQQLELRSSTPRAALHTALLICRIALKRRIGRLWQPPHPPAKPCGHTAAGFFLYCVCMSAQGALREPVSVPTGETSQIRSESSPTIGLWCVLVASHTRMPTVRVDSRPLGSG